MAPPVTGEGTRNKPYKSEWTSGGETMVITTGYGTTANDPDIRAKHDEFVSSMLDDYPED